MNGINKAELIKSILGETQVLTDDDEIVDLLAKQTLSRNINTMQKNRLSFGDQMSDKLAKYAGSWRFVLIFIGIIMLWIIVNSTITGGFDVYPFILLNLLLSCVAAIQAPVIMMSQNRQEDKDRLRSQNDYIVNIKSELIIEDIYKKLDQLIENQKKLMEKLGNR